MTHYFQLLAGSNEELFIVKQKDNGLSTALALANNINQTPEQLLRVRTLLLNTKDQGRWDDFVSRAGGVENISLIRR